MSRTTFLVMIGGLVALIAAGWAVVEIWGQLGVTMSMHGWIAYGLGALASLALSGGLFALLFVSSRRGYDDIDRPEDPDG